MKSQIGGWHTVVLRGTSSPELWAWVTSQLGESDTVPVVSIPDESDLWHEYKRREKNEVSRMRKS